MSLYNCWCAPPPDESPNLNTFPSTPYSWDSIGTFIQQLLSHVTVMPFERTLSLSVSNI